MRNLKEFRQPTSLDEAVALLQAGPGRGAPIGGGTRLVLQRDPSIEYLVDLSRLGLDFIEARNGDLVIGATLTLQRIAESEQARGFAGGLLAEAIRQQSTELVRNAATIGGEIAARSGSSDLLVALLALEAQVVIHGPRARRAGLAEFLAEPAKPSEIVTEVILPAEVAGGRSAYRRLSRTRADQLIVSAAAVVIGGDGRCETARLAVGGAWSMPRVVAAAGEMLAGQTLSPELVAEVGRLVQEQADPPTDFRAGAEYRRKVAGVLAREALLAARGVA